MSKACVLFADPYYRLTVWLDGDELAIEVDDDGAPKSVRLTADQTDELRQLLETERAA